MRTLTVMISNKLIFYSVTFLSLIHSVAKELDAIADPHPKVLNFASTIFPSSSTFICEKMLLVNLTVQTLTAILTGTVRMALRVNRHLLAIPYVGASSCHDLINMHEHP